MRFPHTSPHPLSDEFDLDRWENEGGTVRADEPAEGDLPGAISPSSLNRKAAVAQKPVYPALANHQANETEWDYQPLYGVLGVWFDRFNECFRLRLPRVPLRLDHRIRRNCAGYFLPGHNEFGLVYEIAVAVPPPDRLEKVDTGDLLGTLLHEQLHLLQELAGVPGQNNYHNAQYRDTAERFGLLVDQRGHQKYAPDSPFLDLLAEYGIDPPMSVQAERGALLGQQPPPRPPAPESGGRSKLRKWSCLCTNVRVAVADFRAQCLKCGLIFVLQ
jgi:hypothetical protein